MIFITVNTIVVKYDFARLDQTEFEMQLNNFFKLACRPLSL